MHSWASFPRIMYSLTDVSLQIMMKTEEIKHCTNCESDDKPDISNTIHIGLLNWIFAAVIARNTNLIILFWFGRFHCLFCALNKLWLFGNFFIKMKSAILHIHKHIYTHPHTHPHICENLKKKTVAQQNPKFSLLFEKYRFWWAFYWVKQKDLNYFFFFLVMFFSFSLWTKLFCLYRLLFDYILKESCFNQKMFF